MDRRSLGARAAAWLLGWGLALTASAGVLSHVSAQELQQLAARLPTGANLLVVVEADALFDSPLAQREDWRTRYAERFASAPLLVPPRAQRAVIASQMDVAHMHPAWEAVVVQMAEPVTAEQIVARTRGVLDTVSGKTAVWLNPVSCVVQFAPGQLAMLTPANRQDISRWLRDVAAPGQSPLSSYLAAVLAEKQPGAGQIRLALELLDMFRPEDIRRSVAAAELLKTLDTDDVTQVLASVQGVRVEIHAGQRLQGALRVDFGQDATLLTDVAKPLVLGILAGAGASLDDMQSWDVRVAGTNVTLRGDLTDEGMQRLLSLVSLDRSFVDATTAPPTAAPPTAAPPTAAPAGAAETTDATRREQQMRIATERYFQTVTRCLQGIQRGGQDKSLTDYALWLETYARKLERLSTLNVDPDMVAYGHKVAALLREAVATVHGSRERLEERTAAIDTGERVSVTAVPTWRRVRTPFGQWQDYAPMYHRSIDIGSAMAQQRQITAEERRYLEESGQAIMSDIEQETAAIRQAMTTRYGRPF